MISQNELYNKLQFAKEKYTEYVLQVTERYSRGNINKKIPLKLNVLSNWLQYLESRITVVISSLEQDPTQIILDEFSISINKKVSIKGNNVPIPKYEVLFIKDIYGKTIPISKFLVKENLDIKTLLKRISAGTNDAGVAAAQTNLGYKNNIIVGEQNNSTITINLKNVGSKFNNQVVRSSSLNVAFQSSAASKGRNAYFSGHLIPVATIESYSNILDTIALDLKFSYNGIKDYGSYTSINTESETAASITTMLTEAGLNITDENNNLIKFE